MRSRVSYEHKIPVLGQFLPFVGCGLATSPPLLQPHLQSVLDLNLLLGPTAVWRVCSVGEGRKDSVTSFPAAKSVLEAAPGMRSCLPRGTGPGRRYQAGGPVIQEAGLVQEGCIHDAVKAAGEVSTWPRHRELVYVGNGDGGDGEGKGVISTSLCECMHRA